MWRQQFFEAQGKGLAIGRQGGSVRGRGNLRVLVVAAWVAAVVCVASMPVVATAAPVLGDPCPNGDIRKAQGSAFLPDCMALEQVSPQKKDNQGARVYYAHTAFGPVPVGAFSTDGDRILFKSQGTLADSPAFNDYTGDKYVAVRSAGHEGWETSYTSPAGGLIRGWIGVPDPEAISPDLAHWFQISSTLDQHQLGLAQAFRGGLNGELNSISPLLAPLSGTPDGLAGNVVFESRGASADSSRLYFTPDLSITYLSDDPSPAGPGAVDNTYIAQLDNGLPSLSLLARDSAGKAWGGNCGASVAGGQPRLSAPRDRGAISVDGSRTYFTTRPDQPAIGPCDSATNKKRIMVREETPSGVEIRELFPSSPGVDDDIYEGASIEGGKVYLTTSRPLAASDLDGATDLYLYDESQSPAAQLTNLSGAGTGVPSVATISGDGSHAYFISTDVVTSDLGPGGTVAQAGESNLYLYERDAAHPTGRTAFIATLASQDVIDVITGLRAYPVPVLGPDPTVLGMGGDGRHLFFTSKASLTTDDTDGGFRDIFRYDAGDGTLLRISRAASGGGDNGPFDVFTGSTLGAGNLNAPNFVGFARWVSEDGGTVAFKTIDGLVPEDNNGLMDSYAWHNGELVRLPGTSDPLGLAQVEGLQDRPIVSPDGDAIAFQTYQPLLPRDGDTAVDVYTVRVGGGFSEPPSLQPCQPNGNDGCQGVAQTSPDDSNVGSANPSGLGNVVDRAPKKCRKGKRRIMRKGKVRCVPKVKAHRARNAHSRRRNAQ